MGGESLGGEGRRKKRGRNEGIERGCERGVGEE